MTISAADAPHPFSRPFDLAGLNADGTIVEIAATPAECRALARDLKLPSVESVSARLEVLPRPGEIVLVRGAVEARLHQLCVVTAEPFANALNEPVEIRFAPPEKAAAMAAAVADDLEAEDPPDPFENGRIDLGVVAAEFLALGLDPYPRKPGAVFEFAGDGAQEESPFAKLATLTPRRKD